MGEAPGAQLLSSQLQLLALLLAIPEPCCPLKDSWPAGLALLLAQQDTVMPSHDCAAIVAAVGSLAGGSGPALSKAASGRTACAAPASAVTGAPDEG